MARRTPPLQAVEAFLFATRAQNFRAAAEQLSLSPSGFSRRIRSLEDFLGTVLFDRSAASPTLTPAGEQYLCEIEPAIEAIRAATLTLSETGEPKRLRMMSPHSFAITWLMPRLSGFLDCNSDLEIDIVISRDLSMLRSGRADLAVVSGPRALGELPSQHLMSISGALVSAPALTGGRLPPRNFDELAGHRLLGVDTPSDLWPRWLSRIGYCGEALPEPIKFETLSLMYEAAANGLGVTIAFPAVCERYFRDGRLRPCFGTCTSLDWDYRLVYPNPKIARSRSVRRLASWIEEEMAKSLADFSALLPPDSTSSRVPGTVAH